MSKFHCPRCGATHKTLQAKCRLCGMDMSGEHVPFDMGARPPAEKPKGLGALLGFGILGVLIIGALGVAFGISDDGGRISQVSARIGLGGLDADGWTALEDPQGSFIVEMPGTATQTTTSFPPGQNGEMTVWTSMISDETKIIVGFTDLELTGAESDSEKVRLEELAKQWATAQGTRLDRIDASAFRSYPAVDTRLAFFDLNGKLAAAKAFLILRGDRLYVVQVQSIYPDAPQYVRVLNSLELT